MSPDNFNLDNASVVWLRQEAERLHEFDNSPEAALSIAYDALADSKEEIKRLERGLAVATLFALVFVAIATYNEYAQHDEPTPTETKLDRIIELLEKQ